MGNKEPDSGPNSVPQNGTLVTDCNEDGVPREDGAEELALPPVKDGLAGHTNDGGQHYRIKVSNANGYLCHIRLESTFRCEPEYLFSIFTNPDNTKIFRDIEEVAARKVLDDSTPGLKVVEVEQVGVAKILWMTQRFNTLLRVEEDERDPDNLTTSFSLIRSDILRRFNGAWTIRPLEAETGDKVKDKGKTLAILEQDLLPAGVPSFLKHVPVLGSVLRGISVRTVKRMVEDIDRVIDSKNKGKDLLAARRGARPAGPNAHALTLDDEDSD